MAEDELSVCSPDEPTVRVLGVLKPSGTLDCSNPLAWQQLNWDFINQVCHFLEMGCLQVPELMLK
jgi:hypothetical protein